MSAVSTRQATENFHYDRLLSPTNSNDNLNMYRRNPEMFYITSNDYKQNSSVTSFCADSNSQPKLYHFETIENDTENSNYLSSPNPYSPLPYEQKADMYYLTIENEQMQSPDIHQQPKVTGIMKQPTSPYQTRITTYMIAASNRDNFIPPIPSPPISRRHKKKPVVKFKTVDDNVSNDQDYYDPLPKSKASESIRRSMNKYRFNGN